MLWFKDLMEEELSDIVEKIINKTCDGGETLHHDAFICIVLILMEITVPYKWISTMQIKSYIFLEFM